MIDETHDVALESWVASARGHAEFPIQNLPFGVFSPPGGAPRAGVAIGDEILDLRAVAGHGLLAPALAALVRGADLAALFGARAAARRALRRRVSQLLAGPEHRAALAGCLAAQADCRLGLPVRIGDYTDFYAGIHHAMNVGRQFRPDQPLMPNYKHVPIAYHGRASSVRPSGLEVVRPHGQRRPEPATEPVFGPTTRLDYELELGVWVGPGNASAAPIGIGDAGEHIVGLCLLNDWSARDLQAWEYQPLGPFLAKNFHTTISPWVVTTEALAPFRIPQPPRPADDPRPLPYLWDSEDQARGALAIELEVALSSEQMRRDGHAPLRVSRTAARHMYWTIAQMLTHHASNGCELRAGDLLGTGTISGPDPEGVGSLLERTQGGANRLQLPTGEQRAYLEDGDEVIFSARASGAGAVPIGFGACRAIVRSS